MKNKSLKVGQQFTRAEFVPSTYSEESRTVDVVFATDTPVMRYSWDGPFYEVLDMAGHVTDRSVGTLPVLNNHDRYSGVQGIIGRAENVRLENGQWMASVRFSKRADVQPIMEDVRDGIIQDISVGYSVLQYERSPQAGEIPTYIAKQWESREISFVTVPADFNSKVRSLDETSLRSIEVIDKTQTTENPTKPNNTMKTEQIIAALEKRGIAVPENATDEKLLELMGRSDNAPAATPAVSESEKRAAAEAERKRSSDIIEAVRAAKLDTEFAENLIKNGTSVDEARKAIIDELAKTDNGVRGVSHVTFGAQEDDKVREAMENAFAHRVGAVKELADGAREFRGMSLIRMAEESLSRKGVKVRGLSEREIAVAALGLERGYLSSSDFPIILGNTVNRVLRMQYDFAPRTFAPFTTRTTAKDFRPMTKVQLSGVVGGFDKVAEGSEYKNKYMNESKESYKVEKYGQIIPITWETIINDDLSAFTRIPTAIAQKAAQKQSDIIYSILTSNPNMGDNVALFHANHGNLGSASAINAAALSVARAAMRKQTGLEGDFINITPTYLIVGPDKETEAQQLIQAVIMATKTADTNVFKGSLQIIVEPRLTGNQWYLSADPNQVDTIEYAFLEGDGELFTEQRVGFEVDGMQIKARMVFGAKAIDWRGLFKNPGA